MENLIQIAPLRKDFQRIIDFDRLYPSTKIIVIIAKSDTEKGTPNYKYIEEGLKKLKEYCELAKIQFNMQVIDIKSKNSFLEIIFDFARAFLVDFQPGSSYNLNLGDVSTLMNIGLLQGAQIIPSIFPVEITYYIKEICKEQECLFEKSIGKPFSNLISEPVSIELLKCVEDGKNLDAIKDVLKISLGSVSNHLKYLKEHDLISVSGHIRTLTNLGYLVKEILEIKESIK
ncbi:MAG: winged helix-turn-helix domain-containing protein [Candidatus Heimdallarchaeota archaeon]